MCPSMSICHTAKDAEEWGEERAELVSAPLCARASEPPGVDGRRKRLLANPVLCGILWAQMGTITGLKAPACKIDLVQATEMALSGT